MVEMKKILAFFLTVVFIADVFAFQIGEDLPDIRGFIESDFGIKLSEDKDITKRDDYNIFEQRLQLNTKYYPKYPQCLWDWQTEFNLTSDFLVDWYFSGSTQVDLRQLNISLTPRDLLDIKIGRQILTWGTGDYLFINDIFPKDYVSFFIGRDDEYLKKPTEAIRFLVYPEIFNIDLVLMPWFVSDTIPDGERVSFYDQIESRIIGEDLEWHLDEPSRKFENTEFAMRIYRSYGSYEGAVYFYRGFYRTPVGVVAPFIKEFFYPRLNVYGASLRGPIWGGIGNIEYGYYNSMEDTSNLLIGYEKDLGNDFRIGFQYLYKDVIDNDYRYLLTSRITKLLFRQTLILSFFVFYSPSDDDTYLRPLVEYNVTDSFRLDIGANLIWGKDKTTEFGQVEDNKNIYVRARYSF